MAAEVIAARPRGAFCLAGLVLATSIASSTPAVPRLASGMSAARSAEPAGTRGAGEHGAGIGMCDANFYLEVVNDDWVCSSCGPNSRSLCGSTLRSDCKCNPGYVGRDGGPCTPCPLNTYKALTGDYPCTNCNATKYDCRVPVYPQLAQEQNFTAALATCHAEGVSVPGPRPRSKNFSLASPWEGDTVGKGEGSGVRHSVYGETAMGVEWGTNCSFAAPTVDACVKPAEVTVREGTNRETITRMSVFAEDYCRAPPTDAATDQYSKRIGTGTVVMQLCIQKSVFGCDVYANQSLEHWPVYSHCERCEPAYPYSPQCCFSRHLVRDCNASVPGGHPGHCTEGPGASCMDTCKDQCTMTWGVGGPAQGTRRRLFADSLASCLADCRAKVTTSQVAEKWSTMTPSTTPATMPATPLPFISHKHNHYHNHSQNHSHGTESTVYVIIGAAVGGTFVLLLLIIAAVVCYRGREANPATATAAAADQQFNSIYADEDPSRERGSNHIVSMTTEADPSPMPFEPVPAYANSLEGVHDVCWQQLNVQQARKEVKEFGAAAASKPLSTLGQTAQQSEKEDDTAAATAAVTAAATITSMAVEPTPSGSRSNCDLEQGVLQKRHDGWDHIEKAKEFLHKGLISQDDYDDIKDNWLMKLKDMTL